MKYIKVTEIKRHCHDKGKRTSPGFLLWLDCEVEKLLDRHMRALGPKSTLTLEGAEMAKKLLRY